MNLCSGRGSLVGAKSVAAAIIFVSLGAGALAEGVKLDTESHLIPSADHDIELYIRNKHPAGVTSFSADKILLFIHGATYPAETTFDLPLGGRSMMDYIAQQGWDVYLVDVRGYGGSTRPPEMDKPPTEGKPFADTSAAVKDVSAAVNYILQKRGVAKINLMGWSWGTAIMGMYTAENNSKVNRLVLYAPLWIFTTRPIIGGGGPFGAYPAGTKESAKQRWLAGVSEKKKDDLIPPHWVEHRADATLATAPIGSQHTPPAPPRPHTALPQLRTYWAAGKSQYDPGDIRVPTLLIHAEWDADLPSDQAHAYFAKLTNTPYKRFVEIGEGTHTIIMEKNRMQ